MVKVPHQGDILLLNTAPRSGHEQTGKRPYIVLSHDIIADYSNVVIVAPISSTKETILYMFLLILLTE
ncbi:toxin MazF [Enterococcus faecalis]|uniref:Toxin MazF n=1 Tax=Enterococcus faecalis TaxID=1351 RepID=A0AAX2KTQ5_ENTFL|nr:toxin MazF [Enterococcus faecalis]